MILGPHNDVGKIVRSLSGPETPGVEGQSSSWVGVWGGEFLERCVACSSNRILPGSENGI